MTKRKNAFLRIFINSDSDIETCSTNINDIQKTCRFLGTRHFGQVEHCTAFQKDLERRLNESGEPLGLTIPCKECLDSRYVL